MATGRVHVTMRPASSVASILARTDLIYGSEIGAWRTSGGNAVIGATGVPAKVREARIPVVRWAVRDTFSDLTNASVGTTGVQSRSGFDTAINGIRTECQAEPFIKLPPITAEQLGSPVGPAAFSRTVTVTTTNGSTAATSSGGFLPRDSTGYITGTGIQATTRISIVASTSSITLSLPATASGTITATIGHDLSTAHRATFTPPYGDDSQLTQNLDTYKAIVAQAGARCRLYESQNEMEYVGWAFWKGQGASAFGSGGSVGVSTMLGKHYAANMPLLKKYARTLGFGIVTVGYMGIGGGFNWGNSVASPNTRTPTEFHTAVKAAYDASGGDPDYIPDAVSIHAYPFTAGSGGDFGNTLTLADCIAYHENWADSTRAIMTTIWGSTIADNIRLVMSEWNAGDTTWTGFADSRVDDFYDAWLAMLRDKDWWMANCFALASNGSEPYDMVKEDGTTRRQYDAFKNRSINDPAR
jgi:hypothetical protein